MPEKKLDKKNIELLKKQLLKIKNETVADIKKMTAGHNADSADVPEDVGHSMHMADVATDMYDREFNLGLASNDRLLLQKVENALKRMDDEKYGVCAECKKNIRIARLKALPYTEMCVDCQEEHEKKM